LKLHHSEKKSIGVSTTTMQKKIIGVVTTMQKKSIGVVGRRQCRIGNLVPCARYMCPRAVEAAHAPAKEHASLGLGGLSGR